MKEKMKKNVKLFGCVIKSTYLCTRFSEHMSADGEKSNIKAEIR